MRVQGLLIDGDTDVDLSTPLAGSARSGRATGRARPIGHDTEPSRQMNGNQIKVLLLIEDNPGDARLLREMFSEHGAPDTDLTMVQSMTDAERHLAEHAVDIVLLDLGLPDVQGLGAVRRARAAAPRVPLVVLTGLDDESLATRALREGAQDYLIKGQIEARGLLRALRYAVERKATEEALKRAECRAIDDYEVLLEKLSGLAQSFGMARDLPTVFQTLSEFAVRSTGATAVFISLYDADRNVRTAAYACANGVEIDVSSLPPMEMSDSPHSRAVASASFVVTDDFQAAVAGQPVVHVALDRSPRLPQSSLAVAMAIAGRVVGAIEIQSEELAAFSGEHVTAVRMAANLAAAALENVRAHEREGEREGELRQAQRMEAVGRLAGGIAHDFNNLLTVIGGYSNIALRKLAKDDPLRDDILEIRTASDRAADLTHQLLAFSRKQILQPRILSLDAVVSGMARMLARLIGEDVELDLVLDPCLGSVRADPGQIEQVIVNLAVNARDAMPGGGHLLIETSAAELGLEDPANTVALQPGPYVVLAVSDTGQGMDAKTIAHVFEPFFTTKEQGKGTGLGLSTVYGIVKQSGGAIRISSEPGKGTTFTIYLPRVDELAFDAPAAAARSETPRGCETILLAEDEHGVRRLATAALRTNGYTVLEAGNGGEALLICESHPGAIDLLLTDVVMPKMNGKELADRLATVRPGMKVLFMSGYKGDAAGDRGMLDPDDVLLEKPFSPDALAEKVRGVLDAQSI